MHLNSEFKTVVPDGVGGTLTLVGVHPGDSCAGRPCVVHNPTEHSMRSFRLHWRGDRGIFERICPHGIGHPDPDQFEFWRSTGQKHEAVHGCDGCCQDPRKVLR